MGTLVLFVVIPTIGRNATDVPERWLESVSEKAKVEPKKDWVAVRLSRFYFLFSWKIERIDNLARITASAQAAGKSCG